MKLYISSCAVPNSDSSACAWLGQLSALSKNEKVTLAASPEEADIILIVEIFDTNWFEGLRRNKVWQKYPEKSFAYNELDYAQPFLHGLHCSAPKSWKASGRFQGCAYPLHQLTYPNPCPPMADMSGSPKDLLFSFAGQASHEVRKRLFDLDFPEREVVIENTSAFNHFSVESKLGPQETAHAHFWNLAGRSKYVLCPRGHGSSSMRIYEMMEAGIAPVIISDDWMPPLGPIWEQFSLFVPEGEIGSIYERVKAHESEHVQRGQLARKAWEEFFSPEKHWDFILASLRQIQKLQKVPESVYTRSFPLLLALSWLRPRMQAAKRRMRSIIPSWMN